jgi:predicted dehydrogenase
MDVAVSPSPPQSPLRAAVIGTGKISEEHLRFLADDERIVLAGVCDLSPTLAAYAAERFGAMASYSDAAQMLHEASPAVVHILTPPRSHGPLIRQCLEAGAHVIVEKPVALSHGEFCELHALAQEKGRRLVEDHNYRFNKAFRRIERLVRDGMLGEVREVEVRLALNLRGPGSRYADANLPHPSHDLPAGVIHEFITHLSYLALRFLPAQASQRVRADWSNHGDFGSAGFRYDELDAVVQAGRVQARIRFTCRTAPESFDIIVRGSGGSAQTDLFHPYLNVSQVRPALGPAGPLVDQVHNGGRLVQAALRGFGNKLLQETPYEGIATFLAQTYAALRTGKTPPVTFEDMDRTARLIDAMLAQARGNAPEERAA